MTAYDRAMRRHDREMEQTACEARCTYPPDWPIVTARHHRLGRRNQIKMHAESANEPEGMGFARMQGEEYFPHHYDYDRVERLEDGFTPNWKSRLPSYSTENMEVIWEEDFLGSNYKKTIQFDTMQEKEAFMGDMYELLEQLDQWLYRIKHDIHPRSVLVNIESDGDGTIKETIDSMAKYGYHKIPMSVRFDIRKFEDWWRFRDCDITKFGADNNATVIFETDDNGTMVRAHQNLLVAFVADVEE